MRDSLPAVDAPDSEVSPDPQFSEPMRSERLAWLWRTVPALDSLRNYSLETLRRDLVAGLTVAAVAVPQAMAYATIAGLPPQYGLYTAIVMTAVGALFDSSKQLVNGPTNAISIAVLSALATLPNDTDRVSAAVALALLVGMIQMGITLLRLGDLTRYVSHAVIVGFTAGAAVLIVLDQFKNFVGIRVKVDPHDHFLKRFWISLAHGQMNPWTIAVGCGTIALVLAMRWFNKRLRLQVPEFLSTLVVMSVIVWLGGLAEPDRGVEVVGHIPGTLPGFALPQTNWETATALAPSALAIALLGLLEAVAMAKAIASQTRQRLDINQQCLSEGLANLAGSMFQCYPGSGSLTRSTINQQAGGMTQWSGVFCAFGVAAVMLLFNAPFVAPLIYHIPRASLAGILVVSAWRLVDRQQLVYHLRATRFDAIIVIATAISAVAVSVEFCILIGVFLSFLLYVPRAAKLLLTELTLTPERVIRDRLPTDPPCGKMLIVDLEGELFFGAAPELENHFTAIEARTRSGTAVVILRLKRVRNPDAVCLECIASFLRRMSECGVIVLLCGVRRDLAKVLHSTGIAMQLGYDRIFLESPRVWSSTLEAVRHGYELLDGDLCQDCPRRNELAGLKETWYYMI
jgi:SulP family sulfate permease